MLTLKLFVYAVVIFFVSLFIFIRGIKIKRFLVFFFLFLNFE